MSNIFFKQFNNQGTQMKSEDSLDSIYFCRNCKKAVHSDQKSQCEYNQHEVQQIQSYYKTVSDFLQKGSQNYNTSREIIQTANLAKKKILKESVILMKNLIHQIEQVELPQCEKIVEVLNLYKAADPVIPEYSIKDVEKTCQSLTFDCEKLLSGLYVVNETFKLTTNSKIIDNLDQFTEQLISYGNYYDENSLTMDKAMNILNEYQSSFQLFKIEKLQKAQNPQFNTNNYSNYKNNSFTSNNNYGYNNNNTNKNQYAYDNYNQNNSSIFY